MPGGGGLSAGGEVFLYDGGNLWERGPKARGLDFLLTKVEVKSSAHEVRVHDLDRLLLYTCAASRHQGFIYCPILSPTDAAVVTSIGFSKTWVPRMCNVMVGLSWLGLDVLHCLMGVGDMQLLGTMSHTFGTTTQEYFGVVPTCLYA